jgi:hypothetical protein
VEQRTAVYLRVKKQIMKSKHIVRMILCLILLNVEDLVPLKDTDLPGIRGQVFEYDSLKTGR